MAPLLKKLGYVALLLMAGVYVLLTMTGPRGVSALKEKRRQITTLQEENAELERDNHRRRERIRDLLESREEQEVEIRRRLKLLKPGETTFILPEE
jgi:cell division protein FtsB